MAAEGGRVVTHVPLVVYNGRAEWNAPLQLDAASAQGLVPALERAAALLSALDEQELWQSFVAWCGGTLSPRLGGRMPALVENKETTMLAETLREWDEQKIAEGRREGRLVGRQADQSTACPNRFRPVRATISLRPLKHCSKWAEHLLPPKCRTPQSRFAIASSNRKFRLARMIPRHAQIGLRELAAMVADG